MSITSQLIIRGVLSKQEKDARVINISGRQRMLSQKISKLALQLEKESEYERYFDLKKEFEQVIELWSSSHYGLIERKEGMGLGGENSTDVTTMFDGIKYNYELIEEAAFSLIKSDLDTDKHKLVAQILMNEGDFLKGMNSITFQYDFESTSRIQTVKKIEIVILIITLTTILLEALLIFRPAVIAMTRYLSKLTEKNHELEVAHQDLKISNELKKHAQEELIAQLQENHNLQMSINQELEVKIEERTKEIQEQKEEILQQSQELQAQNDRIFDQNLQLSKVYKKVTDSINYARRLQNAMLGSRKSILAHFTDGFIMSKPKDLISGDFYWFHKNDDFKLLVAADCTGHGVPAAFMTMIGNILLNNIIIENKIVEPSKILEELDARLYQFLNSKRAEKVYDGMDIAIVRIDEAKKEITFGGAKRPMFIRRSNGEFEIFKGARVTIGYTSKQYEKIYPSVTTNYKTGEQFYLCSDGYQDQFGEKDNMKFQQSNLISLIESLGGVNMDEQKKVLRKSFDDWKGNVPQTDDVLIVGIEL
ncbi:serine phosphatase RsbU (regulator of sigma subunit) [Sediminitomix flava]|uniref:Serine phosphatase RsbU (Regulator of sigma subunit) n=2 Tax=Sediminitomix flava TaxID=379075 RepID=A0A315ZGP9_SEDFL|nr:serine phosphatase RsbU (regulator of sigma subunit) [Sediminitomix flava]